MAQTEFMNALRDREEIKVTVKGRRSGREVTLPVWFARQGTTVWLLPLHGSRTQWFRNVLADPAITLRAGRQALTAAGRPRRARAAVHRVLEQFREKYTPEQVAQYYDHSDVVVEVPLRAGAGRNNQRRQPTRARRPTPAEGRRKRDRRPRPGARR